MQAKVHFSCSIQNKFVPLHREPAPGMSVHRQRRVADILKRRLLRSVLTIRNLANFSCVQDLATIDVLRDIELSLLCQLWYVFCAYTYAHTRTLTTNKHESIFYIRRGLRVVGLTQWAMREPRIVERQQSDSTLFYMPITNTR